MNDTDETAIIVWRNERGFCKVVFGIQENDDKEVHILIRRGEWKHGPMLNLKENEKTSVSIEEARNTWKCLYNEFGFSIFNT